MTNWFCITNEESWSITQQNGEWAVSNQYRTQIATVKPGDRVIFYIIGDAFGGSFTVIGDPYIDDTALFTGSSYANRAPIEPRVIPSERKHWTDECVQNLDFLRQKSHWSVHLMGSAMIPISDADFEFLESYLSENPPKTG